MKRSALACQAALLLFCRSLVGVANGDIGFGSREGERFALSERAIEPQVLNANVGGDYSCVESEGISQACQIGCKDAGCTNAMAICKRHKKQCEGIALNSRRDWATLKCCVAQANQVKVRIHPPQFR